MLRKGKRAFLGAFIGSEHQPSIVGLNYVGTVTGAKGKAGPDYPKYLISC